MDRMKSSADLDLVKERDGYEWQRSKKKKMRALPSGSVG